MVGVRVRRQMHRARGSYTVLFIQLGLLWSRLQCVKDIDGVGQGYQESQNCGEAVV